MNELLKLSVSPQVTVRSSRRFGEFTSHAVLLRRFLFTSAGRPQSSLPLRKRLVVSSAFSSSSSSASFQLPPRQQHQDMLLDVSGMMCGACVSRVKSILTSDERVDSAVVNMLTETAAVRLKSGEQVGEDVGESLARRLTECGFPTKRRESGMGVADNVQKWKEMVEKKEEMIAKSKNRVVFAWTLVALCCGSHASHILHPLGIHIAHGLVSDVLHNAYVKGGIALGALLGPGRDLLLDGFRAFYKGSPNMNSLVGFGSAAAFMMSAISLLNPELQWDASFFDEPYAGHASWFCAAWTFSGRKGPAQCL